MKRFARWLYMRTHHTEILEVARYVRARRSSLAGDSAINSAARAGECIGAIDAMELLNLFEK